MREQYGLEEESINMRLGKKYELDRDYESGRDRNDKGYKFGCKSCKSGYN